MYLRHPWQVALLVSAIFAGFLLVLLLLYWWVIALFIVEWNTAPRPSGKGGSFHPNRDTSKKVAPALNAPDNKD